MHFIADEKNKIIFGYTPKCGCTHIKNIFYYLRDDMIHPNVHCPTLREPISQNVLDNIQDYSVFVFIRCPYERLVSGFLDKYRVCGEFRKMWTEKRLTFSAFVDELVSNTWKKVERNHFDRQMRIDVSLQCVLTQCKTLTVYDLKHIDYNDISQKYNKHIPQRLIEFRGGHDRKQSETWTGEYVHDLVMETYYDFKVPIPLFYTPEIKEKVDAFFADDFAFATEHGHMYNL